MKKIVISLVGVCLILALIGCSKESKEPYLTLIYNGYTSMTRLLEYQDKDTKNIIEGELGTKYLIVKQGSKLEFKSSESIEKGTLLIQKVETKEKVKEIILDTYKVNTNIPQGKYLYTFFIEWKNGSAKFIKLIEIE